MTARPSLLARFLLYHHCFSSVLRAWYWGMHPDGTSSALTWLDTGAPRAPSGTAASHSRNTLQKLFFSSRSSVFMPVPARTGDSLIFVAFPPFLIESRNTSEPACLSSVRHGSSAATDNSKTKSPTLPTTANPLLVFSLLTATLSPLLWKKGTNCGTVQEISADGGRRDG
ncbi:hypothetical protein IWX47DRAFT_571862 [Phyllosticta citricarpa]